MPNQNLNCVQVLRWNLPCFSLFLFPMDHMALLEKNASDSATTAADAPDSFPNVISTGGNLPVKASEGIWLVCSP